MQVKILKNNKAWLVIACLLVGVVSILVSHGAHAYDFQNPYGIYQLGDPDDPADPNHWNTLNPATNSVCAIDQSVVGIPNLQQFGFTKRIMLCVKESIVAAVHNVLLPFSAYFANTIAILCVFAVLLWGIQMAAGTRTAPARDAFLLGIKTGGVIMFTSNFAAPFFDPGNTAGGLFGMLLDAMENLIGIVVGYVTFASSFSDTCYPLMPGIAPPPSSPLYALTVWDTVDCALDTLVGGIFSPLTLSGGIVGFLLASLLSSVAGLFIGLLGFMLIAMLLMAIARALYIFITAYIAFSLMVLVSPMFIPLLLFRGTKAYFEKWLRLTIGFMLQPMFIFVYLAMMLAAYDTIVFDGERSLYRAIVGDHIDGPYYSDPLSGFGDGTIGGWMHAVGAYYEIKHGESAVSLNYNQTTAACDQTSCEAEEGISKHDAGTLIIGQEVVNSVTEWQHDIYDVLGESNIFRTSIPMTGLDWKWMAAIAAAYDSSSSGTWLAAPISAYTEHMNCLAVNCDPPDNDPANFLEDYYFPYIIGLMLAGIMAVVTGYIFMLMLEYLPFIGSGITGESLSMPTFGVGSMAPPGSGMLSNIQNKIAGNFLRR